MAENNDTAVSTDTADAIDPNSPGARALALSRGVAAMGDSSRINIPQMDQPPPNAQAYARPGVPLDVTTGVPFSTRAKLSFADNDQERVNMVRDSFNQATVDQTPVGLILRNVLDPETGKPKDMLVQPKDFSLKDLGYMANAGLQLGANIASAVAVPGAGPLKGAWNAAFLSEAATVAVRTAVLNQQLDLGQHLINLGVNTGLGAVAGTAVAMGQAAGGKVPSFILSELKAAPGSPEALGKEAVRNLNAATGENIQPSLGQMASETAPGNVENYLRPLPAFGDKLRAQVAAREQASLDIQSSISDMAAKDAEATAGASDFTPLADVGAPLAERLASDVAATQTDVPATESALATRAASELEGAIQNIAPSARSFTDVGTAATTKFQAQAQMSAFRSTSDQLFGEAGDPMINTDALKPMLARIEASLPSKTVINESDLVNVDGAPLATSEGKAIIRNLVPSELSTLLKGLGEMDSQMPLSQLRRVRQMVDEAAQTGRGLPTVSTHDLKQVQHALTETISQGAATLPPTQAAALTRANNFYKENIGRFEMPSISRLLKTDPSEPGFIANEDLMQNIRSSPARLKELTDFLGSTVTEGGVPLVQDGSKVLQVLRRNIVEDIYSRAKASAGQGELVNADAIRSELRNYSPEVQSQLMGASEATIQKNLNLLKQLKEGYKDLPLDQLQQFLKFPANSIDDLSKLVAAEHAKQLHFNNTIVKQLVDGKADGSVLDSERGMQMLSDPSVPLADKAQVLALVSDDSNLVGTIRQNYLANFWQSIAQKAKPADAARLDAREFLVDPERFINAMRDQAKTKEMRTVLGDNTFNVVKMFAEAQAVLGKSASGSLYGQQAKIGMSVNTLKYLSNVQRTAKFIIYAKILTSEAMQKQILEATAKSADPGWLMRLLVGSPAMAMSLRREYGTAGMELIMKQVHQGLDRMKAMGSMNGDSGTNAPAIAPESPGARAVRLSQSPAP